MESIKEIAQKLAPGYWKRDKWNIEYFDSVGFAESLISAYKAELLKEVGPPVAWLENDVDPEIGVLGLIAHDRNVEGSFPVFTSDQVAAAVARATKPLEDQLAKAEQLWQVAKGRCDGLEEKLAKAEQRVAEWQPIETAPKDGVWILCKSFRRLTTEQSREISWNGKCWATRDCSRLSDPTHWMPLPKAPTGASS